MILGNPCPFFQNKLRERYLKFIMNENVCLTILNEDLSLFGQTGHPLANYRLQCIGEAFTLKWVFNQILLACTAPSPSFSAKLSSTLLIEFAAPLAIR